SVIFSLPPRAALPIVADVSASSCSPSEPTTIPAPAYRRTERPATSAQRMATAHSPSPEASHQPTSPVKNPRRNGSSDPMASRARSEEHTSELQSREKL